MPKISKCSPILFLICILGAFKIVAPSFGQWGHRQNLSRGWCPTKAPLKPGQAVNLMSMYGSKRLVLFILSFYFKISPPVGLRDWNASPFASFEKISASADYSNTAWVGTEPKDEAYPDTVLISIHNSSAVLSSVLRLRARF